MEKISTNPLPVGTNNNKNKNNNNMLSGIGSSTNTKENNNVLDLNFDGMPKLNESSVRAVPLRANFKKSNTCGSLFAKCKCENHSHHHPTLIPLIDESVFERLKSEQNRRKTHSFSHPDTPIVFTEENRYPATTTADLLNRLRGATTHETVVRSGNRKLEIKHSKRSSSPNLIGDYSNVLDIHPEFKVKVAPKSPVKQAEIVRPILKKSSRSFPFTTQHSSPSLRSLDSYCYDTTREEIELSGKVSDSLVINDLDASAKSSPTSTADITKRTTTTTTVADIHNTTAEEEEEEGEETEAAVAEGSECKAKAPLSPSNSKDFSDEKFLQASKEFLMQSGILGPMGSVSSILKKSSRIKPMLSDPTTKEAIRKTSLGLFGAPNNDSRKRSISESYSEHPLSALTAPAKNEKPARVKPISLHEEIQHLKEVIQTRDDEIDKLRREIHKLKSVLQQQAKRNLKCECHLSSLQANYGTVGSNEHINEIDDYQQVANSSSSITSTTSLPYHHHQQSNNNNNHYEQQQQQQQKNHPRNHNQLHILKKQGVSGESYDASFIGHSSDILIRKYEKDFKSKQLIKDAISDNDFLKHLDCVQIRELVESMYSREVSYGEYVIRENTPGNHLFVSAEGEFEIDVGGKILGTLSAGKAFGELAILYNCRRTASIKAIRPNSRVWVLDRRAFQQIMMRTGLQRIEENVEFLKSVPLLKNLTFDVLCKIADVLELEFYPEGAYIIRQGTRGDSFFLISQGSVKVTQKIPGTQAEQEIRTLTRGDYFGEQALIKEDKRTANIIALSPGVECLTLDRDSFNLHIGDLIELHQKDYGDKDRICAIKRNLKNKQIPIVEQSDFSKEYEDMELKDLVRLATIGVGGFGRVVLVKHKKETTSTLKVYALKQMKKVHIVETKQEEHVFNERRILLSSTECPFICRLFRTFRDKKFVYLLLEACLGGEVWTILRNDGFFEESTAQFIIGCVLEAFEFLHHRGIVYRDLKPENLMLTADGYVKLCDFGFAKSIGYSTKTWTFCGTPEYVAPEIILNKGHDRAVDYWAMGILISELITGYPPFSCKDPLKTYNLILKGIDAIDFPKHVSRNAISLIKRLCRDVPTERLGYQRNGIADIRKHKWFQGFDFESLANLTLKPPRISFVNGPLDLSNFDTFPHDNEDIVKEETSGWDENF